jgi:hypothetical protein
MKPTLSDILKVVLPDKRPSVELAKWLLRDLLGAKDVSAENVRTILDEYDDQSYTPTLEEIIEWAQQNTQAFASDLDEEISKFTTIIEDAEHPISKAFISALERYSSNEIDEDSLILEVAEIWRWIDSSPFWAGTAADRHWHVAKIQSAELQISAHSKIAIDGLYDLLGELIAQQTTWAEQLQSGQVLIPRIEDLEGMVDIGHKKVESVLKAQSEVTSYAVKLGFLFRDAWWIENHTGATIRGYLAQQTAQNAGVGGGKTSSEARLRRIKCFLQVHADMIGRNPVLRSDTPDQNAIRALKLAAQKHPNVFKKGSSKKIAVEYWEYIRSDHVLWGEYERYLKTYT